MRRLFLYVLLTTSLVCSAQFKDEVQKKERLKVADTIQLNAKSILPKNFELTSTNGVVIDSTKYRVDFGKGLLYLKSKELSTDSVRVSYQVYPTFLTKSYFALSDSLIVPANAGRKRYYKLADAQKRNVQIFDGLTSSGSISRGITLGNNQNAVVNSQLDLQLVGKLSEDVTLQASLQDANIPIQEGGYSQNLDEFDQIFIALSGKKWKVRAGDIQVSEQQSVFSNFTKKLQGLSMEATFTGDKTTSRAYAAGALVRGVFNSSTITGQEGNQGPYKLVGQNGELFVLIVSGSERVYVNGLLLERGQNKDYIIDYNAGEVVFNTTYPITADMRIVVEYQTSQQNFARIFGLAGTQITSDKLNINAFFYTENDLKNQSLLQDLNNEQAAALAAAGDDTSQMVSPAATQSSFDENLTLYTNEGTETNPIYTIYEGDGSTGENLFQVQFTEVGTGQGNYILEDAAVVNRVFTYRPPINGVGQGNYEPIAQLFAPELLQIGVVQGTLSPNEYTAINFEIAASTNDLNIFSNVDNNDNTGGAARVQVKQQLKGKKNADANLNLFVGTDFIHENFRGVERTYNVEFNRDWNLDTIQSNQLFTNAGLEWVVNKNLRAQYSLEHLDFEDNYEGTRHTLNGNFLSKNWALTTNISTLESNGATENSSFTRGSSAIVYQNKKNWSGVKWNFENNQVQDVLTGNLDDQSQKFSAYEVYAGRGDSTAIYVKAGYRYRENDSIFNGRLQNVTKANTWFANSTLVNSAQTNLQLFANYRVLDDVREAEKDKSLNTRLQYRQSFWKKIVQLNTLFETQNGSFARQDFTYVAVDPGNGVYTWIDYNEDGVQDFDEFEVSAFPDQAEYVRVLLPNQTFLNTNQNKFSQQVNLSFSNFKNSESRLKKWLSHINNQTSYVVDRRTLKRNNVINFNIFDDSNDDIGLNLSIRNSLFFNRGRQNYSFTYNYVNTEAKSVVVTGLQSSKAQLHELLFAHKIKESWLLNNSISVGERNSFLENSVAQNYTITSTEWQPRLSYLFGEQSNVFLEFSYADKKNLQVTGETLIQQKLSTGLRLAGKEKGTLTLGFDWFENDFEGNAFSSVGYQLLEGLQTGTNYVWRILAQKKITKFLELNLDYTGRQAEDARAIHTGSVQLRAFF